MTGYSGTPQAKKLGIKPGVRLAIIGAPTGWALADPPETELATTGPADVVLAFIREAAELEPKLVALGQQIFPAGALWLLWPRKAAGHVSDLTDNVIREAVLPLGLVDTKIAAVDEDWSGLRVVWRVEKRG